jgi:Bacterial EndoU nuclease
VIKSVKNVINGLLFLLILSSLQLVTLAIQPAIADPLPIQPLKPRKRPVPSSSPLLPFFDQTNNPVTVSFPRNQKRDVTPPPPQLNEFDRKVLQTCGPFGSSVSTVSLRRLFAASPDVVGAIKQAIGGEIFPGRRTAQQFNDDLLTIWSNHRGFEHIFCGQLAGSQKIGGLHFAGRYLQLQTEGIAGRLANNSKAEEVVDGEIYTVGVVIVQNGRVIAKDVKKGFAYDANAQTILINATRAFKQFSATSKRACLYTAGNSSQVPFKEVFVKTERAIITFYPDATPSQTDPSCSGR